MAAMLDGDAGTSNLREQILERVRSGIISGRTTAGTIFSVPSLATDLGVSTTPVREALLELARDGLVTPLRNRGFRVEPVSMAQLDNVFALRELLETYALEALARAGLATTDDLRALADAVAKAVDDRDVPRYLATDRAFHLALVDRANNSLLTKLVLRLRDDMRLYGIDSPEGRERQVASVGEHYDMIDVAVKGEWKKAAPLVRKHIMSWKPLAAAALTAAGH